MRSRWRKGTSGRPQREPLTHRDEAALLLSQHVAQLRASGYSGAKRLLEAPTIWHQSLVPGESGLEYLIEVEAFWDDKPHGHIRVLVTIYEDSFHARQLSDHFIVSCDGRFVGE